MGFAHFQEAYPWDAMVEYRKLAASHPDGLVDLSIGTPVDDTAKPIQDALISQSNAPGYPLTVGSVALRDAIVRWFARRRGVDGLSREQVLPTIGSKELVGLLPSLLGLGGGDVVVYPQIAYPTYRVGALIAGAQPVASDDVAQWESDSRVKLVWLNSPGNPTGAVLGVEQLRRVVAAARALGAVVVGDECYAELMWQTPGVTSPSVLDPRVTAGDMSGLLVAYSLSKQSNMAGYRGAFIAGDEAIVGRLATLRKHLGMIVPQPIQAAMVAALDDDEHVAAQRETYARRRQTLLSAVTQAGFIVDESVGGLYLWVRHPAHDRGCWQSIEWLAQRGIIAGPGEFYGPAGARHVRLALTASDSDIAQAVQRLR